MKKLLAIVGALALALSVNPAWAGATSPSSIEVDRTVPTGQPGNACVRVNSTTCAQIGTVTSTGAFSVSGAALPAIGGDVACPAGNPAACVVTRINGQAAAPSATTDTTDAKNVTKDLPSGSSTLQQLLGNLTAGAQGYEPSGNGVGNSPAFVTPISVPANSFVGMDFSGATDMTSALQTALNYAASLHMPLRLCGTYKISAALTLNTTNSTTNTGSGLVGCSVDGANLQLANATQDGVYFSAAGFGQMYHCQVENMTISAAPGVTKTAGNGVHILYGNRCHVHRVRISGMYTGVYLDSTALSRVTYNDIIGTTPNSTAPGSTGIALHGNDVNSYLLYNYSDNNGGNLVPDVGISINDDVNGEYIEDNSFSHYNVGLDVESEGAGSKIQNLFFRQNAWDLCTLFGGRFSVAAAGGAIYRIFMVNEWFAATQNGPGLSFTGASTTPGVGFPGTMGNVQLDSVQIRDNWADGLDIDGSMTGGFVATNLISTANNEAYASNNTYAFAGVNITGPAAHLNFTGGRWGPTAEEAAFQAYGFSVANGVDYLSIQGVNVEGNTTKNGLIGTITHSIIANNPGYIPIGTGPITLTGSPFTYTSGPSPETIYMYGGTCDPVTPITDQGIGIAIGCNAPTTVQMGPNETLAVTYSVAPNMNRIIH